MLTRLRPTHDLANRCSCLIGFAIAQIIVSGSAEAQTLWQTAPARPATLPALVTANTATAPVASTTQSGQQTKRNPQVVHLPPPPGYAGRPGPSAPLTRSLIDAVDDEPTLGSSYNNNLQPLPAAIDPQSATESNANLPPLPSFDDLPLPNVSANNNGLPPAASAVGLPPDPSIGLPPAESPFRRTSVDKQQSAAAFGTIENATQEPRTVQFQSGELVAVVGTEHILAGDMNVFVQPVIDENRDKISSEAQEAMIRAQLTRQVLAQYVEIKAMYLEFFRDMVGTGSPKELADTQKQVVTKAGKIFFEKQVPDLLKKYDAKDMQELENKLRDKSMSLRMLQSQFIEQVLSAQVEQKYVPEEFEIERDEIMEYYDRHREQWNVPARARWRQVTARFDKFATRAEAEQAILNMGNEMLLGGKSFESVAKQSSQGFNAAQGGYTDWTSQGSLKSKPIDAAIFSLEPRKLSTIIEDEIGLHIVEVLEREAAHTVDMAVSQAEIRKKLSSEKRKAAIKELRAKVMKRTPVWTRWPEDIPGSRPLSTAIGEVAP